MDSEIANIEAGLAAASESRPDVAALATAVESAQAAVGQAEQNAVAAEAAHVAARKNLDAARIPLADAERAVQRLDTEAKTLMKLLAVETQSMWPPVIDSITVEKGYEIALGAALGDDLDAPVDQSHAMRWTGAAVDPSDPALPEGAQSLAKYVQAPPELARRLAQIGVVERADGARLAACSSPASGSSRATATCGAGTALPPTPMRRPARRGVWRSAAASPTSTANSSPRAPRSTTSARPPKPRRPT